jgi:hypothetical protein
MLFIVLVGSPAFVVQASELPDDATARETAAHAVLEKHCARCHQEGRLKEGVTKPKSGLGYVLGLRRVWSGPNFVDKADVKNSAILNAIGREGRYAYPEMPDGCGNDASCFPTDEEYVALESWLMAAAERKNEEKVRHTVSLAEEFKLALMDLNSLPVHRQFDVRYISLRVEHNDTGLSATGVAEHKATLIKTLNMLSKNPAVFTFSAVDTAEILVRIQLPELGWDADTWRLLEGLYPYGVSSGVDTALQNLQHQTHSAVPIIRADWPCGHRYCVAPLL